MVGTMIALGLSMFLASLDITIVGTMLPKIVEKFNALTLTGWITSAYILSTTALQPIYGKMCQIYGHQYVLLATHGFFLVGSVICGASKSANMLIAGRVIAGVGGSGLTSLCFVVLGDFLPTTKRPLYFTIFEALWAVSAVSGALLGGLFADKTGFEWGFYINPCIQGVVIVLVIILMRLPRPQGSAIEKLKRIDFIGILTIITSIVLLQLGLVWGGQEYPWKSAAVIITLVLGFVFLFAFVAVEWKLAVEPIMPMRLFKSRNASLAFIGQLPFGIVFFLVLFYYPLYLSVIWNVSAISTGLYLISCVLSTTLTCIATCIVIAKTGIYLQLLWCGQAINATGIGLLALLGTSPSSGMIIGIPIIYGVGIGLSMQPMLCCVQNAVKQKDVATTTSLFMAIRMMGGALGLVIAQSIIQNQMSPRLDNLVVKYPDQAATIKGMIRNQSVIWESGVSVDLRNALIEAYVQSLNTMYYVFTAFAGLSFVLSLLLKDAPLHKDFNDSDDE
ncbi:major facilitator superfamily domain-containing protein [Coemansia spiralis]|nr:major facilitator superfamily domain-containing protein [Coemansia spiralis]